MSRKRKSRNWIFTVLLVIGFLSTFLFVILESNIIFKNSDFSRSVYFYSDVPGDSGYLTLERNSKSLSTIDWVTFSNNKSVLFFSEQRIKESIFIDLPSEIEAGSYYFNVKATFLSGRVEVKELSFRVI